MKQLTVALASGLIVVGLSGCQDQPPPTGIEAQPQMSIAAPEGEESGRFVLGYEGGSIPPEVEQLLERLGATVDRDWPMIGYCVLVGITDAEAEQLGQISGVTGVTRDVRQQWIPSDDDFEADHVEASDNDNDDDDGQFGAEGFAQWQWNLRQVQADVAWLNTEQGEDATVAILDTGLDPFHKDLAGNIDVGLSTSTLHPVFDSFCNDFYGVPDVEIFHDFGFHGSFVGGIVTSNGLRVASVAPEATLIGVKVLDCEGFGSFAAIIDGIIYATDVGADVINMSLGGVVFLPGGQFFVDLMQAAVDYAVANGVLVVAAAGNNGANLDPLFPFLRIIPAQLNNVVSVSATGPVNQTNFDQLASYSNFGNSIVNIAAPGGNRQAGGVREDGIRSVCSSLSVIFTTCKTPHPSGNGWNLVGFNGTSFSAPLVSAAGAVVESELDGNQTGAALEACILQGADNTGPLSNTVLYGAGRLNVLQAVFESIEFDDDDEGEVDGELCSHGAVVADDDDDDNN